MINEEIVPQELRQGHVPAGPEFGDRQRNHGNGPLRATARISLILVASHASINKRAQPNRQT